MKHIAIQVFAMIVAKWLAMGHQNDCPKDFRKINGVDDKCFFISTTKANFFGALKYCKEKNSELFEPKNLQEMASVYTVSGQYVYINYHDIRLEASVEGTENSVFFDSVFMGSRSTLAKIPDNFWYHTYKGGNIRDPNQHCMVARDKTHDAPCANEYLYVCEIRDVHLRNHLENLDEQ
ncbi:uncharacterized protein LOC142344277 [Convolutriloba macropyga]|uniref:uncharacterized protein LOC142344277 n=1 Tax=Convolutriloba macropyga TaxID=536237 RepID=UPI003F527D53